MSRPPASPGPQRSGGLERTPVTVSTSIILRPGAGLRHARWPAAAAGAAVFALLAGCTVRRTEYTAQRSAEIPAMGATVLKLDMGAGYLRVQGSARAQNVTVSAIASAPSASTLGGVQLATHRSGDTIYVASIMPPTPPAGGGAVLDATIRIPAGIALTVRDSAGESLFRNVGSLTVVHGSGSLDVDSVAGRLDVTDGDGDMVIADVGGDVSIRDGSGSIYVTNVRGSVDIPQDGSGEIQIVTVAGSVNVGVEQSGEVVARNVGGDLAIRAAGNGSIEYHDVKGHVTIPTASRH
jgi:hypothetical protein